MSTPSSNAPASASSAPSASSGNWVLAALLVGGLSIGVSFLNVPAITGISGFIPMLCLTAVVWAFLLITGLLFAEATLAITEVSGPNLPSITRRLLGKTGMYIVTTVIATNMYAYLTQYFLYATHVTGFFWSNPAPNTGLSWLYALIIAAIFTGIVTWGVSTAARINGLCFFGLILTLAILFIRGVPHINPEHITHHHWIFLIFSVPTLFSAMGYSTMVPTVCSYLGRNPLSIRKAIIGGITLAFVLYMVWQGLVIGIVSEGTLWLSYVQDTPLTTANFPLFPTIFGFLSLFTVTTSLLAMGVLLVDLFSDALKIPLEERTGLPRFAIVCCIFFPSAILSQVVSTGLHLFLKYISMPVGQILMNGLLPLWLAARARYKYQLTQTPLVPGGKSVLVIIGLLIIFIIYLEGASFLPG